ncbi:hypothetical protein [Halovenus salina]|uniref:Uncharacterized protein n=1 Tax=Halovenus salina TaxID=1510225 RepID=A0ABD5VVL7_9EURY|nr:hypothetical protein [Halovenus salina]
MTAFLESAGEVSPVFEQRLRAVLDDHGITNPTLEEWYQATAFVDAVTEVANTIGDRTVLQAGIDMGRNVPWADEVGDDPTEVLKMVAQTNQDAYRNSTEEYPIGQYQIEEVSDNSAVVGVTDKWPYPSEIAKGAIKGALEAASDHVKHVTISETESGSNQLGRYEVDW